jgi:hypothetical protein
MAKKKKRISWRDEKDFAHFSRFGGGESHLRKQLWYLRTALGLWLTVIMLAETWTHHLEGQ